MSLFASVKISYYPMSRSNGFRIIAWLALVIINGDVARGDPGPNAVALINGHVALDCNVSSMASTMWHRTTDGNTDTLQISSACNITGGDAAYYITEQPGGKICRLIIINATMQLSGVYTCFDGSSTAYSSLVTVIDPVANVVVYNQAEVVEGDQLNISCSINYTGPSPPAPSLRPLPYWTTSPGQSFTSAIYYPSSNVVTLVATVRVQKPTIPIFHCNTVFKVTGNATGYILTAPADNFTVGTTKTEMDVLYVPSNPSLTSKHEVITNNGVPCGISVLTCSSTGNPAPNYRWYDSADSNVILSTLNTLTLGEINRNYKCVTYNTIRKVMHNVSETYTVSKVDCSSTVDCCVYPRDQMTSVMIEGCDCGTLCDCSQGRSGIKLICNATTFPNASYMWSGSDVQPTNSPVYDKVFNNGIYRCTAYFNRTLSNYTGDVIFPTGTNETTVGRCSATPESIATASTGNSYDVAVAASIAVGVILFISLAMNILQLIYILRNLRDKDEQLKRTETSRTMLQPETLDPSIESPPPATYEELTRSNEIHLQPTVYETLTTKISSVCE